MVRARGSYPRCRGFNSLLRYHYLAGSSDLLAHKLTANQLPLRELNVNFMSANAGQALLRVPCRHSHLAGAITSHYEMTNRFSFAALP